MNKLTFTSVSSNGNPQHVYRLHFIFPQQQAPYQRTKLLNQGETVKVQLKTGPFFVVVHRYGDNRLLSRDFSVIDFQQSFLDFGTYGIHYSIENRDLNYTIDNTFFAKMEHVVNTLNRYVDVDLAKLQKRTPARESLRLTHSVFYTLEGFQPALKLPYVALVGRGKHLLKGIAWKDLKEWQSFFISLMPQVFRECSFWPANFCNKSKQETLQPSDRYFLYNAIAKTFSHIVHQKLQYRTDAEVTPFKDYVGLNIIQNQVVGDCEDQAQMVYDLIRIFTKLFPTEENDRFRGSSTLCYHISYWLKRADLWIVQGAVGDNANQTHIWCSLLPLEGGPAHYIESTGLTQPRFYKYIVRAWKMSKENKYVDTILVDPTTGSYGLPSSSLTMIEANAYPIFQAWANLNSNENITNELDFATLLNAPVINPMDLLLHFK